METSAVVVRPTPPPAPGTEGNEREGATATATAPAAAPVALYVGDLHPDVTEDNLYNLFSREGIKGVDSVRVCRDSNTGRSLGYGYVNFLTSDQAHKVIEKLNHTPLNGKPLRIMLSCRDPDARRSGIGNLFVKNLVDSIDNMKLHEIFMEFGTILSCKVATNYDGKSRGYGFVQFDTQESADSAIEKINGSSIGGKQIYVGHFIKKSERLLASPDVQYTNLYMKNLDEDITEELLRLKFSEFGKITNMAIAKDSEGKSKGFAFINFENHEDAKQAMEAMNGLQLGSEALYVARAQKKAERQQFLCRLFEERRNERIRKNVSNVYVKNIDDSVDNTVLRDHFSTCGTITSAKIMRNEKGISKGYGFVCFSTPEEANDAVRTLHGYMFHGKPLYAAIAQRKEERKAQLQMQFAQRMAGLAGSSSAIFPPGYPLYYGTPSGLMPPISSRHGFMYPPLAVRPGWRPSGITIPARPNFPQILPAVISNMPRQQRQRGRTSGHVLPFPNQSMPCDPHLQQANNVNSSKEYSSQQAKYVPNGRAAELNNGPFHPVDANGQSAEILSSMLASVSSKQQKQMLGEQLFPRVQELEANLASKVTGMLLEMDNSELLVLLDCPESLAAKVDEAVQVLKLSGTNKVEQEQQQQEVRKPMIHHPITGPPRLLSIDQLPKEK